MFYCRISGILVAGAGLLAGCQPEAPKESTVYFGPTAVYHLETGLQEITPSKEETQLYEQRFNFHPRYNQPLHRLVRGKASEVIYLGVVMPPAPGNVAVLLRPDSVWQETAQRAVAGKTGKLALFHNPRRHEYNVRYVGKVESSGNTHVINLLTTDSAVAQSYYLADKLFRGNLLL